jgi:Nif-specific regulatory protein
MFKSAIDPHKLEAFLEINELLNSRYFDLNGLFTQILQSATQLINGESSSLLLLQPNSQRLEFVVALGPKGEEVKLFSVPKGEGIAGWVAEHNTSIHVADVEKDPRFYSEISRNVGYPNQNILAVPLRVKGQCVGVLEMINKKGGQSFLTEDMTWLELFANQAGLAIQNAKNFQAMKDELQNLKTVLETKTRPHSLLTQNSKMAEVLELCRKYASTESAVLITGENGTGKELIAEYIHEHSPRAQGPFVRINCAALPEALLESELFGHVRGAFTDAVADRQGRLEQARGGTLFLDEIGTVPLFLQSKLLRVLQTKTIEKVGGNQTIELDIRIVAATNAELEREIETGAFRQDLFYRLNVLPVHLPPLRERRDDVTLLAGFFLREMNARFHKSVEGFEPEALEKLRLFDWPGNVRQLQNTVERAVVLTNGQRLTGEDLGLPEEGGGDGTPSDLKVAVQQFKAGLIERTLLECRGNQTRAARQLGIQRTYLSKLIKELNIEATEKGVHNVPKY